MTTMVRAPPTTRHATAPLVHHHAALNSPGKDIITDSLQDLRVGNKYRIGRKIGSGSFGDIYLGKDVQEHVHTTTQD